MCFSFRMCGSFGFLVQVFPVLQEMPSYFQHPEACQLSCRTDSSSGASAHSTVILSTSWLSAQKKFSWSLCRKHSIFGATFHACFQHLPLICIVVAVLVYLSYKRYETEWMPVTADSTKPYNCMPFPLTKHLPCSVVVTFFFILIFLSGKYWLWGLLLLGR